MCQRGSLFVVLLAGLLSGGCSDDSATPPGGAAGGSPSGSGGGGPGGGASGASGGGPASSGGDPGGMSFFVTSTGNGVDGGNYGGLEGADAKCQKHAATTGAGDRTWRAYLSTTTVSARDRIGGGPWRNQAGQLVAANLDALHESGIDSTLMVDENGAQIPLSEHDIVTGSFVGGVLADGGGSPQTCLDWTTNNADFYAWVGHFDWSIDNEDDGDTWNAVHETPCSQDGMATTASAGRLYCFAAD